MVEGRSQVSFDATVLFAGTGWPRWPYEVLRAALAGNFDLVLTEQVITEAHRRAAGRVQATVLEDFLANALHEILPMPAADEVRAQRDLIRDETDVPIAVALLAGNVDIYVRNDKDWTEPGAVAPRLRQRLRIMLPAAFLREVAGWDSAALEAIRHRTWADVEAELGTRPFLPPGASR